LRRAVFRAQRQVNELVVQEPMDREAIAAAFEQLRQASMEYQKVSHAQATELFALLTPEQRVMALKFMQNRRDPERRERSSRDSSESRSPKTQVTLNHACAGFECPESCVEPSHPAL